MKDDKATTIIIFLILVVLSLAYVIYSDRHPNKNGSNDPSDTTCSRSYDGGTDCY